MTLCESFDTLNKTPTDFIGRRTSPELVSPFGVSCCFGVFSVRFRFVLYWFSDIFFHFVFLFVQNAPTCSEYESLAFSKAQKERFMRFP